MRVGLVMRQEVPGRSAGRIILAHGPPLPFAEVGPPAVPRLAVLMRFLQPFLFRRWHAVPSPYPSSEGIGMDIPGISMAARAAAGITIKGRIIS